MKSDLRKLNRILQVVLLFLILIILVITVVFIKMYSSKTCKECEIENNKESNAIKKDESLDNYSYIGIYSYSEDNTECSYSTTLVLTSDYQAIFYVGNCNNKAYYYGKYRIEGKKIYLYSLVLEDSTSTEELKVGDDEIYFNLTDDTEVITSLYGRNESIKLKKLYNAV